MNDCITIDFGTIFNNLKNSSVPADKQIPNTDLKLIRLGNEITELANLDGRPFEDPQLRYKYQNNLAMLCQPLVEKYKKYTDDKTLNVVIERGAILINSFFPVNHKNLLRVTGKRIKNNSDLGVKFSNFTMPENLNKYHKLSIQEDCIATGDTIAGLILMLKNKGIEFEKIIVNCPVAAQQGIDFLKKTVKNLELNIGLFAYGLNQDFYIMRDDKFFVGDMGEWSKILPKNFDRKAVWNKKRLDYC